MKTTISLVKTVGSTEVRNFDVKIELDKLVAFVASEAMKTKKGNRKFLRGLIRVTEVAPKIS
jgi:hypothetical protein